MNLGCVYVFHKRQGEAIWGKKKDKGARKMKQEDDGWY